MQKVTCKSILLVEQIVFKMQRFSHLHFRYEDLLNDPKNYHIDRELAVQFLEMYQKYECSVDAADTLFEVSGPGFLTYWECEGSTLTNWKDRGFVTVLDIMMVNSQRTVLNLFYIDILPRFV